MNVEFGTSERACANRLIEAALAEDLGDVGDLTSHALIAADEFGTVRVTAREAGVLAGGPVATLVFERLDSRLAWRAILNDGDAFESGDLVAEATGPVRSLLAAERTILNFLTHLSGVATRARSYVTAIAGTSACILDTRKTLPGWRALEKYAVRAGGGTNHRAGLFDAVLIKDNHLAAWTRSGESHSIAAAVRQARRVAPAGVTIEVEVDTLAQLDDALAAPPDIILLDNMPPAMLAEAVRRRDAAAKRDAAGKDVRLEASGGILLANVRGVAETGVERISIGALTHSAPAVDLAFDWPHG